MFPALLGLAAVVAAPAVKEPPKKEVPAVVGSWALDHLTFGPANLPKTDLTVTFGADGTFTSSDGKGPKKKGSYKIDAKKDPPEMDISDEDDKGPAKPAIYKVEGDTLTVAARPAGDKRPTNFEAAQDGSVILMVFKRVKD